MTSPCASSPRQGSRRLIGQIANEKQTIINLVAAELGAAIVPRWTAQLGAAGVVFQAIALKEGMALRTLPLSIAYLRNVA